MSDLDEILRRAKSALTTDSKIVEWVSTEKQDREAICDYFLKQLPELYDGGVTFKKPDEAQIIQDYKTIGRNEAIKQMRSIIEQIKKGER